MKVDLMNKDEHIYGQLPLHFQCKTLSKGANYHKLLSEMPTPGCILHKLTSKSEGGKFMPQGEYAIMHVETLLNLLYKAYGEKED